MPITPNLSLITINRSQEAATKFVGAWIDEISGEHNSNMTKIDAAVGLLKEEARVFTMEITGDGTKTEFVISHDKNTFSPMISVVDTNTGSAMLPDIMIISATQISIKFLFPLTTGSKCRVYIK